MKKITSILLSVAIVLSLAACGGDSKDSSGDAASSGAEAETSGEINVYVGVEEP